jgi:protein ImuB
MRKALSLFLPDLLVDLTRRRLRQLETGSPTPTRASRLPAAESSLVLVVERVGAAKAVVACCRRCASAGIVPGMSLAHALALTPGVRVHVEDHRPDRGDTALRRLAVWLARHVPIVAPDPPDGLVMDIGGCERLFGSDERHARKVGRAVCSLGLRCRIAVAPTAAAAWACARFAPRPLTMVGHDAIPATLSPLPVAALRLDPHAVAGLLEVGVRSIGDVLRLPRPSLAPRFGSGLALRLDQALGHAIEVIEPVRPAPPLRAERVFDGGTTRLETLHLAFDDVLQQLLGLLGARGLGVRLLDAHCARVASAPVAFTVTLSRPSRNFKHLRGLLARGLEGLNMGFGVEAVSLTARRVGRLPDTQQTVWVPGRPAEHDAGFAELIDVLSDRLGAGAVTTLVPVGTHIPERTLQPVPAVEGAAAAPPANLDAPRERPTLLLSPPEPIAALALVPDGPPLRLDWRDQVHEVLAAVGPERIAPEWWLGDAGSRDYYRVQVDPGIWLWVFREQETSRWRLHGVWA